MKTILITGASNGIGYHTAFRLATEYRCRVIAISRNLERLQMLKSDSDELTRSQAIIPVRMDITDYDLETLLHVLDQNGITAIDALINNAGTLINKPFQALTDDDWKTTFEVNLFGAARLIRSCLHLLKKSNQAHIVNIGSYGGFQGSQKFPGLSAYSASKGGMAILTEALSEEFRQDNISVNCLALGTVNTEMVQKAFPGIVSTTQPDQTAAFISWFCLNGQNFFNGKILPVTLSAT